jgi:hypothetical protein
LATVAPAMPPPTMTTRLLAPHDSMGKLTTVNAAAVVLIVKNFLRVMFAISISLLLAGVELNKLLHAGITLLFNEFVQLLLFLDTHWAIAR